LVGDKNLSVIKMHGATIKSPFNCARMSHATCTAHLVLLILTLRECCDVNTTENELTVNRAEPTAVLPHPLGPVHFAPPAPLLV
jgi:hypothetical protein